jgi:hypothetical protein
VRTRANQKDAAFEKYFAVENLRSHFIEFQQIGVFDPYNIDTFSIITFQV